MVMSTSSDLTLVTVISGWFRPLPHCSGCEAGITCVQAFSLVVSRFDGLDGVFKRLFQNPPADGPEYEAEQPPRQVFAVAYDNHINVGRAVGLTGEGVGVARRATPHIGVGRREDDAVGIGPVVVQALPDPTRAFRDIGMRAAPVMHLEVRVGAVAKELRATRPEIGQSGDVLLGRRCGRAMKVDGGHVRFPCYVPPNDCTGSGRSSVRGSVRPANENAVTLPADLDRTGLLRCGENHALARCKNR